MIEKRNAELMLYKVTVAFSGTAVIQMEAASPEAARLATAELTLPDLARPNQSDVHALKIAAREITAVAALSGEEEAVRGECPAQGPTLGLVPSTILGAAFAAKKAGLHDGGGRPVS